jgi:hypothetical protein
MLKNLNFITLKIINILITYQLKFEVHKFKNHIAMIDIWKEDRFFVLQIEESYIGFSDETEPTFGNKPDITFIEEEDFFVFLKKKLEEL